MTAAALSVATVLLASAEAFTVWKLVGAAYLVLLGVQAIRRVARYSPDHAPPWSVYRQSLLANVLSP